MIIVELVQLRTHLFICILLSVFLTNACSNEVAQPGEGKASLLNKNNAGIEIQNSQMVMKPTEAKQKQSPENKLITRAKQVTSDYKLTEIALECLSFELLEELFEGKRIIDVREQHSETCGGDLNTSPRLFSIAIDESNGSVWSDAKSLLGQLEELDATAKQ